MIIASSMAMFDRDGIFAVTNSAALAHDCVGSTVKESPSLSHRRMSCSSLCGNDGPATSAM